MDLLDNGGRLGLSALNIKKYKTKALGDEILLNKNAGIYYYKTPDGNFISIDYIERVDQIKNVIINEMTKNLLFDFKIFQLNVEPALISNNIVQELLNPTMNDDNYDVLDIPSSESGKYALSLFLDIVETSNTDDVYAKSLANNIHDDTYKANVAFTDSVNTTIAGTKEISSKFIKLDTTLGTDFANLTGNITIKNILLQADTFDIDKARHILGAYVIAVKIDEGSN